jgi:hypothetical protein
LLFWVLLQDWVFDVVGLYCFVDLEGKYYLLGCFLPGKTGILLLAPPSLFGIPGFGGLANHCSPLHQVAVGLPVHIVSHRLSLLPGLNLLFALRNPSVDPGFSLKMDHLIGMVVLLNLLFD